MRWTWLTLVLVAETAQAQESLKGVLLLPPVSTVTVGKKGAFVGVDTRKTVERFDAAAHKRLVSAFDAKLKGKVLPADVAQGLLDKAKVTVATIEKPGVLEGIAKAANVDWLVTFGISKNNLLTAQVRDSSGKPVGESVYLSDAAPGLSDAQAGKVADQVVPKLLAAEKTRVDAIAEAARRAEAEKPLPVPMADCQRRHHLGIEQRMPRQLAVEHPAVPVGPIHHGRNGEYFSFVIQCLAYKI